MTHSFTVQPGNGRDLLAAAVHFHEPVFLQCNEREGGRALDQVEAWLTERLLGPRVACYDEEPDVLGVALENLADAVMFKLRWGEEVEIVELGPEWVEHGQV